MTKNLKSSFLLLYFLFLCAASGFAADVISGTVHNMTNGKPAAGDDVVLLQLTGTMPEEARTKTDAQGAFTLNVTSPQAQHLLRVVHQGVNYDQPVSGAGPLGVTVYDAVPKIASLSGPIGIAQVESDGKLLKVTEMYDISNRSDPPVTQARADNYVITLPPKAVFDSVEVRRGQGIWLKAVPEPVKGKPGTYAINFAIRPGDTLYKFTYHLPDEGATTLRLNLPYPIQRFGVMHPSSIKFKALTANAFKTPGLAGGLTVEQALASPMVGPVPAFQVSGTGSAPPHGSEGTPAPAVVEPPPAAQQKPPAAEASAQPTPAAGRQMTKELWLMVGGIVVLVIVLAFALWRPRSADTVTLPPPAKSGRPASDVDALKEELFQLETSRLHGSISAEEYANTKKTLTESIERALAKGRN